MVISTGAHLPEAHTSYLLLASVVACSDASLAAIAFICGALFMPVNAAGGTTICPEVAGAGAGAEAPPKSAICCLSDCACACAAASRNPPCVPAGNAGRVGVCGAMLTFF